MNILDLMQGTLYLIMNALLYPVMAVLIFLVVCTLFSLGGFLSEYMTRRKNKDEDEYACIESIAEKIASDTISGSITDDIKKYSLKNRRIQKFLKELLVQASSGVKGLGIRIEKLITSHENTSRKTLDKTRLMIRVGPMLGLMGTLIPMGPALLSLSKGDLTQMANCLIIAFGTTVAGLAVSVIAYIISVMRERWYRADADDMEYLSDLIMEKLEGMGDVSDNDDKRVMVVPLSIGHKK
ncbi:MAG: MotA/TolQ/ExbB proton channel family protein [Deltaproteobacteria bacterium]|nr:MotA/TolQ/ExbB proton channel family protein [Deltaproteobacteria bacterium]